MHKETGSIKVPLVFEAGHMLVVLPQGKFVVDTGSPGSFGTTGKVTYGTKTTEIQTEYAGFTMRDLAELGLDCHGLIGMDIISEGPVLWDGPAGIAEIGSFCTPPHTSEIPITLGHNTPLITALINGLPARCVFDTGAQYGYADKATIGNGQSELVIHDYNPALKWFQANSWTQTVRVGDVEFTERFGIPRVEIQQDIARRGAEAILGCSWMPQHKVWFNPADWKMYIA
jgi:hypothetical protein